MPSPCTFPGADDIARIGVRSMTGTYSTFTPRAVGTAQVKDLHILSGSKLTFTTFTTTGTFNLADLPSSTATLEAFVSGSVFNNNGTMNVLSTGAGASAFAGVFTLFNNGTFNLNKLTIAGQTIVNQPTASIFIGDFSFGTGAWTFNNLGLLSKPSSPGTTTFNLVNLTNSGSIEAGNGILELGASGSTLTAKCGRFRTLASGATIKLLATLTVATCTSLSKPPAVAGGFQDLGFGNADFGLTSEQPANPQSAIRICLIPAISIRRFEARVLLNWSAMLLSTKPAAV